MKIKRYMRWKRDVAAAQKRVDKARELFCEAIARHARKAEENYDKYVKRMDL